MDSSGIEWEYVGKTRWHEYIFARKYSEEINRYFPESPSNKVDMSEFMSTHWNGVESNSDRRKIVKVKS